MKMYIVVRADLPGGAQIAQACHALRAFGAAHPGIDKRWYAESNNLVVLQVESEEKLLELHDRVQSRGIALALFHEVDLGMQATALCIAPGGARYLSSLPLAMREPRAA